MTHQILRTFLIFFHTSAKLWHTCLRTRDSIFILVGLIFWTYVSLVSMDSVSCNHVAVFSLVCSAKFILLPIVIEWMHRHIPKITEITWLFLKFVSCYSYLSHKKKPIILSVSIELLIPILQTKNLLFAITIPLWNGRRETLQL